MFKFTLERLKEPSTIAGLCALAVLFGVPAETAALVGNAVGVVIDSANAAVTAVGAVTAAVAIVMPNKK